MSSIHVGPARVMLVEASRDSMSAEAFKDRLDMVLLVVDNGGIGRGDIGYGSNAHLAALDAVEEQIKRTRENAARINAGDFDADI